MAGRELPTAIGVGLVLLALPGGCRSPEIQPNLVLILVDTLRADHLRAYGYPRETSPALDGLAARGVRFEEAVAVAPWTLPSAMSILTGRLPSSHRVENDGLKLTGSVPLLAEVLREAGYATGAVVSHIYVSRIFGFDRGFDRFEDFDLSEHFRFEAGLEPRAADVTDRALAQVRVFSGRPFFLFVHYFDPHWDYDPPPPFDARFAVPYRGTLTGSYQSFSSYVDPARELSPEDRQHLLDLYDGEIAYTDSHIGRLLDGLAADGRTAKTVVVVTADHGEEFKEHGSMGHGRNLYDEVLRVPLIVADGRRAGPPRTIHDPVSGIDLFPTLCGLAGTAPPPGTSGRDLRPLLEGQPGTPGPAISETIRFDAYRKAYRENGWKLIVSLEDNRRELYDLRNDPGEKRNLWAERGPDALRLEEKLFAKVDVLSGGWDLRWTSDGTPHRFSGSIETDGIFTEIVPLFPERGRHRVRRGKRMDFDLEGVRGGGGLSFQVEPPEARVGFALAVDGAESADRVAIGGRRIHPPSIPFSFSGALRSDILTRPASPAGKSVAFSLWKNPGRSAADTVELNESARERLRSLGYIQ